MSDSRGISRAFLCSVMWEKRGFSHPRLFFFFLLMTPFWIFEHWLKLGNSASLNERKNHLWAPAVRLLKKSKQFRFVMSLQQRGASPLLHCSSSRLCEKKVISEAFSCFPDTYFILLHRIRVVENSWLDHGPFFVLVSLP